jgi:phenylalanyl-tRNA synthetase beta chain
MEMGSQFVVDPSAEFGVRQDEVLTLVVAGQTDPHWSDRPRALDLYDLVGELHLLEPRIASIPTAPEGPAADLFTANFVEIRYEGALIGMAGEVRKDVCAAHDIERGVAAAVIDLRAVPLVQRTYRKVGQFPSMRRDLALIVGEDVPAGRVIDVVRTASPLILRDVGVFDVYRDAKMGSDKKSIGIGMIFRSDERTLVDAEVDAAVESIITAATETLGASVRGATAG